MSDSIITLDLSKINADDTIELCRAFVRLDKIKKSNKKVLEDIQDKLDFLDEKIQVIFQKNNCSKITVDGRTVYNSSILWVSKAPDADQDEFFKALDEEGIGECIKKSVNTQSLSAYYRDKISEQEELKIEDREEVFPALEKFVSKVTKYKVKSVKAGK